MLDWLDDLAAGCWAGVATLIIGAILIAIYLVGYAAYSAAFGAERGVASVYSSREGKWTASGERMIDRNLTAAHRTLRFGTRVLVRHGARSVILRINDRGPFVGKNRIIDLTTASAKVLDIQGLGTVTLQVLNDASNR